MGGGASAKVEKKKEDSDSSDSDWVEEDDHKDGKSRKKLTKSQKKRRKEVFTMKMKSIGTDKFKQKCLYEHLKKHHPVTTILPTHLGKTWTTRGNPEATAELKHVPKLLWTHDSKAPDPDAPSDGEEESEPEKDYVPTGNNAVDGPKLFKDYQKQFPQADKFLYWNKISKEWDVEALIEDIYVEKSRGKIKVLKDKVEEVPKDLIEFEKGENGEVKLPEYKGWEEVALKHTNQEVAVHYTGKHGMENFNDMYRTQTHYSIRQRLAHYNRDLARGDRLHRAKGMYTLMKMRRTDKEHYQAQRKKYELNKKTGLGVYRPETEKYLSLHWKPEPDHKAVYYTDYLMREHHEHIDDDPNEDQFVTVKDIDSLGFKVEWDHALHQHNGNQHNETGKLKLERKQEIERNQRIKAERVRDAAAKAARSVF